MSSESTPLPRRRNRPPGRPKYTDEPVTSVGVTQLAEAEQTLREDAARNRLTLTAVQIELSREYLDPEVRERVLRRAKRRSLETDQQS